jgi:hypothetical protein
MTNSFEKTYKGPPVPKGSPPFPIGLSEQARDEGRRQRMREAASHQAALWTLAEAEMPDDLRQLAARWKLTWLAQFCWVQAFCSGWRAAMEARIDRD